MAFFADVRLVSSLGEGRVDMFSRHFFADVFVSELSLGEGRVDMFSRHFFANVLCVSIRVSCGSRTAPRFEYVLYFCGLLTLSSRLFRAFM